MTAFSGVGVLLAACAGWCAIRRHGSHLRRARAERAHSVAHIHCGSDASLLLQRSLFSYLLDAGLDRTPRLGRAANALCAPGAGICNRGPGDVPLALRPLRNGLDRRALPHRRCPLAPPSGQVIAATEAQQSCPSLFTSRYGMGLAARTQLGSRIAIIRLAWVPQLE